MKTPARRVIVPAELRLGTKPIQDAATQVWVHMYQVESTEDGVYRFGKEVGKEKTP